MQIMETFLFLSLIYNYFFQESRDNVKLHFKSLLKIILINFNDQIKDFNKFSPKLFSCYHELVINSFIYSPSSN